MYSSVATWHSLTFHDLQSNDPMNPMDFWPWPEIIMDQLVGGFSPYPSEKSWTEFVSWDDDIPFPTVSGKSVKIPWFQSPPTSLLFTGWPVEEPASHQTSTLSLQEVLYNGLLRTIGTPISFYKPTVDHDFLLYKSPFWGSSGSSFFDTHPHI